MIRVGLVSDTHVGEYLDEIPRAVFEALAGCDLVIHSGDLSVPSVLDDLARIAPVVAVSGDHDRLDGLVLPESAVVAIGGVRIGVTHGKRPWLVDAGVVVRGVALGRRSRWREALHAELLRRVGPVDCLVYGHWHEPVAVQVGGTLIISPGAVCPWGSLEGGRPPGPGLTGVVDRVVARFRRRLGLEAMRPRVGILEIEAGRINHRFIPIGPPGLPSPR